MGYDERQQPNSSGALVAVIGVGLVLAILAIIVVAGVGLFWVRASTQQAIVMEQRAIAAKAEAQRERDLSQLEQSLFATGPAPRLNFVLELDRDGIISVGGDKIDLDELRTRLTKFKDETSNAFSVHIKAEPECPVKYVVAVCDEVGDIDYRITSAVAPTVKLTAMVASYEPAAEWDHFDDGTFSAYDKMTLQVVAPERHAGTTFSVTVPPTEFPEDSAFRTAGTQFSFTVRESDIGATGIGWGAIDNPAIEQ